jgi:hypothetical protein
MDVILSKVFSVNDSTVGEPVFDIPLADDLLVV